MKRTTKLVRNSILLLSLVALIAGSSAGQSSKVFAIRGAKIYTLAGDPIGNGTVVIRNGKIAAVGTNVSVPRGAEVVDASGLQVYPGLFDSITRLGLTEIGQVAATNDAGELGRYNPHLNAATAIHPASEHIPVARANGITHALALPGTGGGGPFGFFGGSSQLISGQAPLINLEGWTVEEMLVEKSVAMVLNWPSLNTLSFSFFTFQFTTRPFTEVKKQYEERINELTEWLEAAQHYAKAKDAGDHMERNIKLEALVPVLTGKKKVIINARSERDIKNALEFAEKFNMDVVLAGGTAAWKIKDLLKEKNIPVILPATHRLPSHEDEAYDKPNTTPGELHAAGIKIAFATFGSANVRTLPYEAGNAVSFGLPWEEALKTITINPAQIFGVDDRLGTIEQGKIANLIVTDGDPLEYRTQVKYLFINGQLTSTDNKHKRLYEKYRARP